MGFSLEGAGIIENADFAKPQFSMRMTISFCESEKKAYLRIEGSCG